MNTVLTIVCFYVGNIKIVVCEFYIPIMYIGYIYVQCIITFFKTFNTLSKYFSRCMVYTEN